MEKAKKLKALQGSEEMKQAIVLLIAAQNDCDLHSYIRFTYSVDGVKYEMTFLKIENETIYDNPPNNQNED